MSYKLLLIIFVISFLSIKGVAQQQSFFAGQADGNVIYTNIEPDKKLSYNENPYRIDLDRNGINDFEITRTFIQGPAMSQFNSTTIAGINKNKIIYNTMPNPETNSRCDTFKIVRKFNFGDPINTLKDSSKEVKIEYASLSDRGNCEANLWRDIEPKYIGVILNRNDSLLYGWLKVDFSFGVMIVMEYGINIKGVTQIQNKQSGNLIKLFPNPAMDFVQLFIPFAMNGNHYKLSLFNSSGIKVIDKKINQTNFKLDLSKFSAGIYFVEVSDYNTVYFNQKITKK
ncbi:MAG TPA: T9SS type A sorting domain-containing protein [Prolixibacteraceae bacterium]|jgi:hypothetical protein